MNVEYYNRLPPQPTVDCCFVLDCTLASGGTACATISILKQWGIRDIVVICILASSDGLKAVESQHPDVKVFAACVDDKLDVKSRIVPGIGDAGDRLHNTAASLDGRQPLHAVCSLHLFLAF